MERVELNELEIAELEEAVEAGAEFMDIVWPKWWRYMNVSQLSMSSGRLCVIGQGLRVFDAQASYEPDLFGFHDDEDMFGFTVPDSVDWGRQQRDEAWGILTDLWREEIIDRWPTVR